MGTTSLASRSISTVVFTCSDSAIQSTKAVGGTELHNSALPCFFGYSLGGYIAITVAAQYPQWVNTLMIENLHLYDPAMLDSVIDFDKMHTDYDYEHLF